MDTTWSDGTRPASESEQQVPEKFNTREMRKLKQAADRGLSIATRYEIHLRRCVACSPAEGLCPKGVELRVEFDELSEFLYGHKFPPYGSTTSG